MILRLAIGSLGARALTVAMTVLAIALSVALFLGVEKVRTDWNGRIVRLPGFIVPIDTVGTAVTAFILVPYVGACIHVPPPPANQLVFVTTEDPYESEGLYAPVNVTGMFGVAAISTHLAQIGYALSAEKIEPFRG